MSSRWGCQPLKHVSCGFFVHRVQSSGYLLLLALPNQTAEPFSRSFILAPGASWMLAGWLLGGLGAGTGKLFTAGGVLTASTGVAGAFVLASTRGETFAASSPRVGESFVSLGPLIS